MHLMRGDDLWVFLRDQIQHIWVVPQPQPKLPVGKGRVLRSIKMRLRGADIEGKNVNISYGISLFFTI